MYLKEPFDAFSSLVTNSITGYIVVSSLVGGYYFTGFVSALPFFVRSYLGSQQNIKHILERKKLEKKRVINDMLKTQIILLQRKIDNKTL